MKIVLIFPPYSHRKFSENLPFVDNEFGIYPPLNLLIVAAILEKAGHKVSVIDIKAEKLSKNEVIQQIKLLDADLSGFMLTTYMFNETLEWIRFIKANTGIKTLVGGININLYPEETMSHIEIDFGFRGEAYPNLEKFIEALEKGKDYSKIPGLCYRNKNKIILNEPDQSSFDYDSLPIPARHLIDNSLYYSFPSRRKNFTIITTTKGCPHNCNFCAIAPLPYYSRNINLVIEEIIKCYNDFNIREIEIFDANFTANRKRVIEFCEKIIQSGIDMVFACRSRIDTVDPELLRLMRKAGFERIYFGIETPSKKTLKLLNKQLEPCLVENILKSSTLADIEPLGFFMLGNPGEGIRDILRTIFYSIKLPLSYAQFCMTIPKPGSAISQDENEKYWKSFIKDNIPERPLSVKGRKLSTNTIVFLTYMAYLIFYIRPSIIIRRIKKLNSPYQLLRYFKAGFKMLYGIPLSIIKILKNIKIFYGHTRY